MSWVEDDAFTGWRHYYAYLQRAGVRKKIKKLSHRIDRRKAKREVHREVSKVYGDDGYRQ